MIKSVIKAVMICYGKPINAIFFEFIEKYGNVLNRTILNKTAIFVI